MGSASGSAASSSGSSGSALRGRSLSVLSGRTAFGASRSIKADVAVVLPAVLSLGMPAVMLGGQRDAMVSVCVSHTGGHVGVVEVVGVSLQIASAEAEAGQGAMISAYYRIRALEVR